MFYCAHREDDITETSEVLLCKQKHHKGSIYCAAWNPAGDVIATGSNDKTIRMTRFDVDQMKCVGEWRDIRVVGAGHQCSRCGTSV